ncbi:lanthionine synthetase C family protein [Chryseobacterium indologenes]|uniref:lanthionine synthetase C family protein n=1 Tax=Chryseobacterium indologenes TaxID=253 RepID=UPI004057E757
MNIIFEELEKIKSKTSSYMDVANLKTGLLGDLGGLGLFYYYHSKQFNDNDSLERGEKLSDEIISNISVALKRGDIRYSNGVVGFAWLLKFFNQEEFVDFEAGDVLSDLDELIFNYAINELDKGNFDFLHGATGALHYFLTDEKALNEYAKGIISKLHSIVEYTPEGKMYWPFFSLEDTQKLNKFINFGLAHGQPAVVSVLSKAYELNPNDNILKRLIEDTTQTIIDYKYKDNRNSLYPSSIPALEKTDFYSKGSRMGWCYGDLGVAAALWDVGKRLGNASFQQEALQCMEKSALRKDLQEGFVRDAAVCHGSSGIMHIFNKFSILTEGNKYKDCVDSWKNASLELLNTDNDKLITGHCAWNNQINHYNDFGFLQGLSGVGLTLLSLVNPDIKWGEALLI